MIQFKIAMKCNTAPFKDAPATEVARILRGLADRCEREGLDNFLLEDREGKFIGETRLIGRQPWEIRPVAALIALAAALLAATPALAQDSGPFSFAPAIGWYSTPGYSYDVQPYVSPAPTVAPGPFAYPSSYPEPSYPVYRPSTIPPGPYDGRRAPWER